MTNEIQIFQYEGQDIEFDVSNPKLMVNATEMAKIFDKRVENFTRNEDVEAFIQACLNYGISHNLEGEKSAISRFLAVTNRNDLIVSRQRSGTWMHRILALKFAAWLNPDFEVWVYLTIDQILQGQQPVASYVVEQIKQVKTVMRDAVEEAKRTEAELLQSDVFQRWQSSQAVIKTANNDLKRLEKQAVGQLDIFVSKSEE